MPLLALTSEQCQQGRNLVQGCQGSRPSAILAAMSSAHIFFDSAPHGQALSAAPSLARLLARADVTLRTQGPRSLEGRILAAAGMGVTDDARLPIAALTATLDGLDPAEYPLRADPICLRPDLRDVVLLPGAPPALDRDTAAALIAAVNGALPDPNRRLAMGESPERWYVASTAPVALQARPPRSVAGGGIREQLPQGPDRARWLRWLTEVEFVLHAAPANRERLARGLPPVNSLWLWGAGHPDAAATQHGSGRQFRWSGATVAAALTGTLDPMTMDSLRSLTGSHRRASAEPLVMVVDQPIATHEAAARAEQTWAQPLWAAIWRGDIHSITLSTPEHEYCLRRWQTLRLWRR